MWGEFLKRVFLKRVFLKRVFLKRFPGAVFLERWCVPPAPSVPPDAQAGGREPPPISPFQRRYSPCPTPAASRTRPATKSTRSWMWVAPA